MKIKVLYMYVPLLQGSSFHITCIVSLKCLNTGTPKIINFPFVSNGKLMFYSVKYIRVCPASCDMSWQIF